ncbi:MAG: hypothetical protein KF787_08420 [Phycisphaeraceae bacterium]|nr:hypothetical protein [Phycisphaerae bacterium]MBX3392659.1 hypothetical protein [Phycisphaeraceae bacterium]
MPTILAMGGTDPARGPCHAAPQPQAAGVSIRTLFVLAVLYWASICTAWQPANLNAHHIPEVVSYQHVIASKDVDIWITDVEFNRSLHLAGITVELGVDGLDLFAVIDEDTAGDIGVWHWRFALPRDGASSKFELAINSYNKFKIDFNVDKITICRDQLAGQFIRNTNEWVGPERLTW